MLPRMARFLFLSGADISTLPAEVEVLYKGKFNHPNAGDFEITDRDLDELVANQKAVGVDAQIDVDHRASKGDTRAAGWIKELRRDGDRLYASVDWTGYGEGLVKSREYRYISAEYGNVRDDTTGEYRPMKRLKAITLTNRPFLKDLKPVTLSDGEREIILATMPSCKVHDAYDPNCMDCVDAAEDAADDAQAMSEGSIGGTKLGSLPKSSYAWVDASGVGHLPYKDANGKIDAAHTRNALARIGQVKGLSGATRDRVRQKLEAALRSVGGHPGSDSNPKGDKSMSDTIRAALHLSDDASDDDVVAAIAKLAEPAEGFVTLAEHQATKTALDAAIRRVETVEKAHADLTRDSYLTEQLRAGKVTPDELDDLKALFDVAPDKVKAMVERRKANVLLSTIGHGGDDTAERGDVRAVGTDRKWLDEATRKLMAANDKLTYGEAMILAAEGGEQA